MLGIGIEPVLPIYIYIYIYIYILITIFSLTIMNIMELYSNIKLLKITVRNNNCLIS